VKLLLNENQYQVQHLEGIKHLGIVTKKARYKVDAAISNPTILIVAFNPPKDIENLTFVCIGTMYVTACTD